MGRPDFDPNAYESTEAIEPPGTSIENAYFGADTPESSVGVLFREESNVNFVFGTRVESTDGAS